MIRYDRFDQLPGGRANNTIPGDMLAIQRGGQKKFINVEDFLPIITSNVIEVDIVRGDDLIGRPFKTLRAAVDAAVPGTHINVWPGVYPQETDCMRPDISIHLMAGVLIDVLDPGATATAVDVITIGTGAKVFHVGTGKDYMAGDKLVIQPSNAVVGTSVTSLTTTTGAKTLQTQAGLPLIPGLNITIRNASGDQIIMHCTVTSYSGTTLVVNAIFVFDDFEVGTFANWEIHGPTVAGTSMYGSVTSYVGSVLTMNITSIEGSGTSNNWSVVGPSLGVFDDRRPGRAGRFTVTGDGEITYRNRPLAGSYEGVGSRVTLGAVVLTNIISDVTVKVNRFNISTTHDTQTAAFYVINAKLLVIDSDTIQDTFETSVDNTSGEAVVKGGTTWGIYWVEGETYARVKTIIMQHSYCVWCDEPDAGVSTPANFYLSAHYISSDIPLYLTGITSNYRAWIECLQIKGAAITLSLIGPMRTYINSQKISAEAGVNVSITNQELWLEVEKLTTIGTSSVQLHIDGTKDAHITCQMWEDVGGSQGIQNGATAGTLFLHGGIYKATSGSFDSLLKHSGTGTSKTRAMNMVLDGSANTQAAFRAVRAETAGLTLQGCVVYANNAVHDSSIYAPTVQTVTLFSTWLSKAVHANVRVAQWGSANLTTDRLSLTSPGNVFEVSALDGNDNNGPRFKTVTGALAAAVAAGAGSLVVVGPGTYNERDLWRNNIHVHLMAGALISFQDPGTGPGYGIFDDRPAGSGGTSTLSGDGELYFKSNATPNEGDVPNPNCRGAIVIQNSASKLTVNLPRIRVATAEMVFNTFFGGVHINGGTLSKIYVREILDSGDLFFNFDLDTDVPSQACGVVWLKGKADITVERIITSGFGGANGVVIFETASAAGTELNIRVDYAEGHLAALAFATTTNTRYNFKFGRMIGVHTGMNIFGAANFLIDALSFEGGAYGVNSGANVICKVDEIRTGIVGWNQTANVGYVECKRFIDLPALTSGNSILVNGSSAKLHVSGAHIKFGASAVAPVRLQAGKLVLTDMIIDTTANNNAGNHCIQADVDGLTLRNCALFAPALANSINAPATKTVQFIGNSTANKAAVGIAQLPAASLLVDTGFVAP
jgi:hypothetical protein